MRIVIPYDSPDQAIDAESIGAGRGLIESQEERRISAQVTFDAYLEGISTFGELFEALEDPDERRRRFDQAAESCGLPTVAERRWEAEQNARPGPSRDEEGRRLQICGAPGCEAYPTDEFGSPMPVADRRWFCAEHRDMASDRDRESMRPQWIFDPRRGGLVTKRELEQREELRRTRAEQREREREAERRRNAKEEARWLSEHEAKRRYWMDPMGRK